MRQHHQLQSNKIEADIRTNQEINKKRIDEFLDKSKCMSCMAPIDAEATFCPQCGFELRK